MVNQETRPEGPAPQKPGLADTLFGALFYPRTTFDRLAADPPPYGLAVGVFAVSVLVSAAGTARTLSAGPASFGGLEGAAVPLGTAGTVLIVIISAIFAVISWFGLTGIRHLLAVLLGGSGDATVLFRLTPLADLPGIFMLPATIILAAFGAGESTGWTLLLAVVFGLWGLILVYRAIRAAYGLSRGRALGVLFLPALGLLAAFLLTFGILSVWFVTDLMEIVEMMP